VDARVDTILTGATTRLVRAVARFLPQGHSLPDAVWERRHAGVVFLLWLHAIVLTSYAVATGPSIPHALAEGAVLVFAALLAGSTKHGRKVRAGAASFGLISASALLVHLSGGYVEMHFHFFVIVALMALYQDWVPFSLAILYVVIHHGLLGVLSPTSVYNHPAAWEHPWERALIHGVFVLAASAANMLAWRLNEHQALHDALTGLPNRALFKDRVEHALARVGRQGRPIAVLFLDLDRFKSVNDRSGHAVGDQLLRRVGSRLLTCARESDTVARLGGDEFAILLEDVHDTRDAVYSARRILEALEAPFKLRDKQVAIGASIGIGLGTPGHQGYETLIRNADVAMYAAKRAGRGRYALFEAGMHDALVQRLKLEEDLRIAVEREEFLVQYQPIVALDQGRLVGVEALIRWRHPERGIVSPSEFITAAEDTGLIVPMGRWMLMEACRQARLWQDEHPDRPPLRVSVNLSPMQLQHQQIVQDVADALEQSALNPRDLQLEVTESVLMEETDANIATLERLKTLGVSLAIDDFGTGYSSLSYLRRFPIDVVKIDKTFIDGITDGPEASALARAIINLGQTLHLRTVAEGIEQAAQYAELRELGCDLGQGYHFARPLPAEGICDLLTLGTAWAADGTRLDAEPCLAGPQPEAVA
jgi:diguanylate cyclase (GGDEF)-like protein